MEPSATLVLEQPLELARREAKFLFRAPVRSTTEPRRIVDGARSGGSQCFGFRNLPGSGRTQKSRKSGQPDTHIRGIIINDIVNTRISFEGRYGCERGILHMHERENTLA